MPRIRRESLEIDDLDPSRMALLDLLGTITMNVGTTEWICGHCDETLLHLT